MWWIENPSTGLLKIRERLQSFTNVDIDYCQFSDCGYKKPTRFWGSQQPATLPDKLCDPTSCPNMVLSSKGYPTHRMVLGGNGPKATTQQQGRIPPKVIYYLLEAGPRFAVMVKEEHKVKFKEQPTVIGGMQHGKGSTMKETPKPCAREKHPDLCPTLMENTSQVRQRSQKGIASQS